MADDPTATPTPLSASRLRAAFARMLGKPDGQDRAAGGRDGSSQQNAADAVTPDGIVEALLFVGEPDGGGRSAEALAATIRDTTPTEVDAIVRRLNEGYERFGAAYRIEHARGGYRLRLEPGLERVGDRLAGRVRSAQLTPEALQTLSVVAYRQPIDAEAVRELCGPAASTALRQLTRLGLVHSEAAAEKAADTPKQQGLLRTTDRFLRTLGLASVKQLPRVAELDD